jgi:hypothetical protein
MKYNDKPRQVLFGSKKYAVPDDGAVMRRNVLDWLNQSLIKCIEVGAFTQIYLHNARS